MSKGQRVKRLRNVGFPRPQVGARPVADASLAPRGDNSHSQGDASNSESSASGLGSAGSCPEGPHSPTAPIGGGPGGAPTGGSASSPTEELTGYDWYGEYVELTEGYAWRVAAYIAWAASPVVGRKPATQLELAQAIGLKTDRTIRQWKEKEPAIEAEIKRVQAGPLLRHRRDLYEALVKAGVGGDVPAIKLAFEMSGDYTPRLKQTVDANMKTAPFTADELAQAEAELKAFKNE